MADELSIRCSIQNSGTAPRKEDTGALSFDQTNPGSSVPGTVTVGLAEANVDLSALTTPGYCTLRNLSATATVQFGPDSTGLVNFGKLRPGGVALFEFDASVTLRMVSSEANTLVEVKCEEA